MPTDSSSLPGTCCSMQLCHSMVRSWVGRIKCVLVQLGNPHWETISNDNFWVSAGAWKHVENLHRAIFLYSFLLWWTWPKRLQASPPHTRAEGCLVLEREIFVLKWVLNKGPGSGQCFRVCKMTPRNLPLVITPGLQDSLPSDHLPNILNMVANKESRTETFLTLMWENVSVSAQNKLLNCSGMESCGQRNCAPRSS